MKSNFKCILSEDFKLIVLLDVVSNFWIRFLMWHHCNIILTIYCNCTVIYIIQCRCIKNRIIFNYARIHSFRQRAATWLMIIGYIFLNVKNYILPNTSKSTRRISSIKSQYECQPSTNRLYQLSSNNHVVCCLGFSLSHLLTACINYSVTTMWSVV